MLEFVSVNISSSLLVSQLPLIKPRRYSIASAPRDNTLSLVVGVTSYQTPSGRHKRGLASGMLETAPIGTIVPGCIKLTQGSRLILPEDPVWPVIMIGAGSGIAPFRGFWQRRWEQHQAGLTVGKTLLYFGCRRKTMNLLRQETEAIAHNQRYLLVLVFLMSSSFISSVSENGIVKRTEVISMHLMEGNVLFSAIFLFLQFFQENEKKCWVGF